MTAPLDCHHLDGVLLRVARDDDELVRLAELDSARPLAGPALVAETDGAIVAALCLSTGRAIADPFVPTRQLVELLRHDATRRQASATASRGNPLLPRAAFRGAER